MVFNRESSIGHELGPGCRHDWTQDEALALYALPFNDLVFQAQTVHRAHFNANEVQISTLLSIKTGGCPEDCAYCPQSAHFETGLQSQKLMTKEVVLAEAKRAKDAGASRFCMGAAWRAPRDSEVNEVAELVAGVKALGLETCATLGMLTQSQAERLKEAGLDYYNHNLDTSESYYDKIITTRTYQDRLDTLDRVREAGIHVCCGGIVGMGERVEDRAAMLCTLANLPEHPESVPINMLVRVEGTPLAEARATRTARFRADNRGCAHHDAGIVRAALGRARGDERRDAGALLSCRRELDFLRREAADHP